MRSLSAACAEVRAGPGRCSPGSAPARRRAEERRGRRAWCWVPGMEAGYGTRRGPPAPERSAAWSLVSVFCAWVTAAWACACCAAVGPAAAFSAVSELRLRRGQLACAAASCAGCGSLRRLLRRHELQPGPAPSCALAWATWPSASRRLAVCSAAVSVASTCASCACAAATSLALGWRRAASALAAVSYCACALAYACSRSSPGPPRLWWPARWRWCRPPARPGRTSPRSPGCRPPGWWRQGSRAPRWPWPGARPTPAARHPFGARRPPGVPRPPAGRPRFLRRGTAMRRLLTALPRRPRCRNLLRWSWSSRRSPPAGATGRPAAPPGRWVSWDRCRYPGRRRW